MTFYYGFKINKDKSMTTDSAIKDYKELTYKLAKAID